MGQFSNIMGYSGRYFTNEGFLGMGANRISDLLYTVIVDNHPRLNDFVLTWNSEKGWLPERFDEQDMPFIYALQEAIDKAADREPLNPK